MPKVEKALYSVQDPFLYRKTEQAHMYSKTERKNLLIQLPPEYKE